MRLSCLKALLPVVALATACHEATAPPAPGLYSLETFNSRPLPTVIVAGGRDTITLVGATLALDGTASAVVVSHSREVHPTLPPRDVIDTARYSYRIVGDSIAFDNSPQCPPDALCALPPYGKVTSSTVTLFEGVDPKSRYTYFYRAVALD